MKSKEVNFWDYVIIIVKWRKLIVTSFVIVCIIASVVSLILPKWYKVKATLLPPVDQTSSSFRLASMLSELPIGEFGVPGVSSPLDIFKAILESRTVAEAIVNKLNLVEVYHKDNIEDTIASLWNRSRIEIGVEGIISITVEDRDPELAAAIANSYVQELDELNQRINISQAKNTRVFVEERLREVTEDLKKAEEALRDFQSEHKTVSLSDQVAAAIQAAAEIRAKQVELEVEKGVLSKVMSNTHPEVVRLKVEIEELQKQLDELIISPPQELQLEGLDEPNEKKYSIPLSEVPSVGLQLARLTRDLKIQEAVFELLTQQYEQAKIQEAKDTPTVQILDPAVPPEQRSKPKRKIIVLVAGVLSLFVSTFYVFLKEYLHKLAETNNTDYQKLQDISRALRSDYDRMKRKLSK